MAEFSSDLITLDDVVSNRYLFNIPIYQRLYVWGKEQIHTLLDDIVSACQEQKSTFYLGGTLVIEREHEISNNQSYPVFDLIDGQQRFTTLWLISVVLGDLLKDYQQVETDNGSRPRIRFAIRPEVTTFFERVCQGEQPSLPQAKQLEDALENIHSYFVNYVTQNKKGLNQVELAEFIRHKVQLILTKVPGNIDLNKLFEVINNRGVQLQHHEILKAKLLEKINQPEREAYAQLWDACANMDEYVERNLRQTTKIDTVSLYEAKVPINDAGIEREQLANARAVITALGELKDQDECDPISLEFILTETTTFTATRVDTNAKEEAELPDRASSIITFSMLLQHVLRIFLQKNAEVGSQDISKVSDKDLLVLFELHWLKFKPSDAKVKAFIELLWQVRYLFDKHVIKWVMVEDERVHAIRRLYVNRSSARNTAYLQRLSSDAEPDFALLQSMLYHSQQMTTQYWLTPLLNFLLEHDEKQAYLYLCHLDNHLLCSEADASLVERTRRYLVEPWHEETVLDAKVSLNQHFDNGTQYPHYWFYKLEFVLYLKLKAENPASVEGFRMTAKNSVEHVTPQNPEKESDRIPDDLLHCFGNLALVTRSLNSEMSNKGFSIKKAEFEERHRGQGVSFKLEDIYANTKWQKDEIKTHQDKMVRAFNQYTSTVSRQVKELTGE